jgi:hypothetical protein
MKSDAKHLQSELDRIVTHRPGKVSGCYPFRQR